MLTAAAILCWCLAGGVAGGCLVALHYIRQDMIENRLRKTVGACPSCGSISVDWSSLDFDNHTLSQAGFCLDCSASWLDFYRLTETLTAD